MMYYGQMIQARPVIVDIADPKYVNTLKEAARIVISDACRDYIDVGKPVSFTDIKWTLWDATDKDITDRIRNHTVAPGLVVIGGIPMSCKYAHEYYAKNLKVAIFTFEMKA